MSPAGAMDRTGSWNQVLTIISTNETVVGLNYREADTRARGERADIGAKPVPQALLRE